MKSFAENENVMIEVDISDKVDQKLKNISTGFVVTSDSQIIEMVQVLVIDLARNVLEKKFNPYFINLGSLQNKIS